MEQRNLVVLSISGSLRKQSTNSRILSSIEGMLPTGVEFRIYDGLASLPHFSPDLDIVDDIGPHEAVLEWREQLRSADAIIICTPEYARGVPGSLKNALDWVVSSGEFMDKPTAVISASPHVEGGATALTSLITTLKMMSAAIPDEATLAVPFVTKKIGPDGSVIEMNTLSSLSNLVRVLIQSLR
ncbi:MAG: NAD(P)H-dependent oxidoreductase [Paenibacillus sp.]|nr:NAD(P)H-dependent oxidoreductase [Paenibacillus sp.]